MIFIVNLCRNSEVFVKKKYHEAVFEMYLLEMKLDLGRWKALLLFFGYFSLYFIIYLRMIFSNCSEVSILIY